MKEALRYSAALLGELRTSLLRWGGGCGKQHTEQDGCQQERDAW